MTTPPLDIPALLDLTADLEVGHPIEAVLRAHGKIPTVVSAYEVVKTYANALGMAERRKDRPDHQSYWAERAELIRPCVAAIAERFTEPPNCDPEHNAAAVPRYNGGKFFGHHYGAIS